MPYLSESFPPAHTITLVKRVLMPVTLVTVCNVEDVDLLVVKYVGVKDILVVVVVVVLGVNVLLELVAVVVDLAS